MSVAKLIIRVLFRQQRHDTFFAISLTTQLADY